MTDRFIRLELKSESAKYIQALNSLRSKNVDKAVRQYLRKEWGPRIVASARKLAIQEGLSSSGALVRNMQSTTSVQRGLPVMKFGVFRGEARKYFATQELGTKAYNPDSPIKTIKPKVRKFLTIPNEKDPRAKREMAPQYPGGLVAQMFKGLAGKNHNIAGKLIPKDKQYQVEGPFGIEAAYFLATHVDVPPRFIFLRALNKELPKLIPGLARLLVGIFRKERKRDPKVAAVLKRFNI